MAREHTVVGIDIGTHYIYTVVASLSSDLPLPQIIGIGRVRSSGMRRGMIIDLDDVAAAVAQSVHEAEQTAGISISKALVSIGGNHIVSMKSHGVVAVSRADGEISEEDVSRVITAARTISLPPNREILHTIPNEFIVDGEEGLRDVLGLNGLRLETNTLVIGGSSAHLRSISRIMKDNNIEIEGFVLSPLASSFAVLSKRQRELGVLCLDIGGGTTDIAVYEEGNLIHINILPLGGENITNDLAIGLRISTEIAERVKREYGLALTSQVARREVIELAKFDPNETSSVLRKDVVEIMEARLNEIFDLTNRELKRIGKEAFLPAGVVLIGGSARIPHIVDMCRAKLRLPVQLGFPRDVEGIAGSVDDPSYATVLGLIFWGFEGHYGKGARVSLSDFPSLNRSLEKTRKWVRAFLP